MALVLADGQLGATSGTVLGAGTDGRVVAVTLYNTSEREQTVSLTVTRSGSSARTIARAKLAAKEALYVTGLPLDPSDVLAGSATAGAVVDYLVTISTSQFTVFARDATGAPKQATEIELTTTEKFGLTMGELKIVGVLEEMRDLLAKIA